MAKASRKNRTLKPIQGDAATARRTLFNLGYSDPTTQSLTKGSCKELNVAPRTKPLDVGFRVFKLADAPITDEDWHVRAMIACGFELTDKYERSEANGVEVWRAIDKKRGELVGMYEVPATKERLTVLVALAKSRPAFLAHRLPTFTSVVQWLVHSISESTEVFCIG